MSTLVLFDIDGTLVLTSGAGVRGMNAAFAELYGWTDALDGVPIAGRTDRSILTDVFERQGVAPTPEALAAARAAYLAHLRVEMLRPAVETFGVLPGVESLIERANARPAVHVGLLTGNFEGGAEIKLRHFDLWRRFAFGAYGDDHLDRRDLVPVAIERATATGVRTPISRVVVIGDTPLDIDCAHAHGAFALAVATGLYSREQLAAAGADSVVGTLEEVQDADWLA